MFCVDKYIILYFVLLKMTASCDKNEYIAPSLFLNHGGGPYPILGEELNAVIAISFKEVKNIVDLKRLKAIILVTAHREEEIVTISSNSSHELLYDYYNFPPESYKIKYNAPGDPNLANRIHEVLKNKGIESALDSKRGWDHGVFIPMLLINPAADIPIVQVSILKNQDAVQHYALGEALSEFRKEGVAILGSGMSYHNMHVPEFRRADYLKKTDGVIVNKQFDKFITEVCTGDLETRKKIVFWEEEGEGYECHPKGEADHLMPLIVNAGAGGKSPGRKVFEAVFAYKFLLSGFIWDEI